MPFHFLQNQFDDNPLWQVFWVLISTKSILSIKNKHNCAWNTLTIV